MAKVRELFTVWGFEIDMKPIERMDQAIETTKEAVKELAAHALVSGAAVFGLAKFVSNSAVAAGQLSQKIGVSTDALQELQYAASLTGLSSDELQVSMKQLSRHVYDASRGVGEAGKPFATLGIRIRDAGGHLKSGDVILTQLSDKFAAMPDGVKKTALAVEIFGRSGEDLIPLLNKGSKSIGEFRKEAHDLGLVFTSEEIASAKDFNLNVNRLIATFTGIRNIVGNAIIPIIKDVVVELQHFVEANKDLIATNLEVFVEILKEHFEQVWAIGTQAVRIFRNLTQVFGGVGNAAKIVSGILSTLIAIKLAYGIGQGTLALISMAGGLKGLGTEALVAQAKLFLIPLAIAGIIAAIALVAEDFLTFSNGGNSVIGLLIGQIDGFFDKLEAKIGKFALVAEVLLNALLLPLRTVVNAFGIIRDLMDTVFGNKTFKEFILGVGGRLLNNLTGSLTGNGFASAFGLQAPDVTGKIPAPSGTAIAAAGGASGVKTISQTGELNVNVLGLPPDIAQATARDAMTAGFENLFRAAGREASSQVER
jgi:hypothetical protein